MKKIVMLTGILILLILLGGGISLWLLSKEPKVAVLCYHNIATKEEKTNFPEEADWIIEVENFEEQLKALKEQGYTTLSLSEFIDWKLGKIEIPKKSVLITFDDGFLSNYHYAFPLLKKYEMKATVFVIGQYMQLGQGRKQWSGNVKEYLNLEMLEQAKQEYPNIDFASHSLELHVQDSIYTKTKEELAKDLEDFKERITLTTAYAYPFGAYNEEMIQALQQAGYKVAFIYGPTKKEYRKASRKDENYKIPRLNVSHGMEIQKFTMRLRMPF